MAIVAGTYTRFTAVGVREDLSNVIYNISPEETPFVSNVSKEKVKNTLFEWQTDALDAAVDNNAVVEGDEAAFATPTPTVRLGNYTQISRKTIIVSGTLDAVDRAGRATELAYQTAKRGAEMKRDMERMSLANQAGVVGNTTTPRRSAGVPAWLTSNVSRGTGGANGTLTNGIPSAAATDATAPNQRPFTETLLKGGIQSCYNSGAKLKILMVGPFNKGVASGFTGIADIRYNAQGAKPTTIIGAADVYVSDFGNLTIVPNRFQRERDAFLLDPEYAAIATLRPMQTIPLAKTGDAEKRMLIVEWGIKMKNEAAHGIVADLTTA
jgi:hypothetical protein